MERDRVDTTQIDEAAAANLLSWVGFGVVLLIAASLSFSYLV